MLLRKMCEPKVGEVAGGWRELHDMKLYDCIRPSITVVIKWRMR
jgi:hypothetical protein